MKMGFVAGFVDGNLAIRIDLAIPAAGARVSAMSEWEQRYRAGDTPWEKGAAAPPLIELIEKLGPGLFGEGPVWVPGCGSGHDVRLLAQHDLKPLGVDIAPSALERARAHAPVGGESYELADFLDARQLAGRQASAVWEHTCFCAIDPQRRVDYARCAAGLLEPGRVLAGVFFLTPYDCAQDEGGPPHGTTVEELDACFAPWFERVAAWVPERAYPGREGREWLAVYRRFAKRQVAE